MYNLNWTRKELTTQKVGAFCEYYAKMALSSYGLDIFSSEVDDHGIDFVAQTKKGFLKFQVKSLRDKSNYVFMREKYFDISDDSIYLILILLKDDEHPKIYLIPATTWQNKQSNLFVYHEYKGLKSDPEYGVNVSKKNMMELEQYRLETVLQPLMEGN